MAHFIPVQYGRCSYPAGITPRLVELAGHFDAKPIQTDAPFSLHTEYSYAHRTFSSPAVLNCPQIRASHRGSIPRLWATTAWAEEFSQFVVAACNGHTPSVIEVHPPFDDYSSLPSFLNTFRVFETAILRQYPDATLLVENRSGTLYRGGGFILSTASQLTQFSQLLDQSDTSLKITLDIPQLFTAHNAGRNEIVPLLAAMRGIRHNIAGIHLWGKRKNAAGRRIAHTGDLNSYFYEKQDTKTLFLSEMLKLLDDGVPRYFVPEVNSGQADFLSILWDLLNAGFQFQ